MWGRNPYFNQNVPVMRKWFSHWSSQSTIDFWNNKKGSIFLLLEIFGVEVMFECAAIVGALLFIWIGFGDDDNGSCYFVRWLRFIGLLSSARNANCKFTILSACLTTFYVSLFHHQNIAWFISLLLLFLKHFLWPRVLCLC